MRRLGAAILLYLGLAVAALAQQGPPVNPVQCAYNSSPPSVTSGFFGYVQCDSTGKLITSGGLTGNVSNASSSVATTSTNLGTVSYNYVWNGTTWDQAGGLSVGTAGTAATQVISVQGIAGMTPVTTQGASTGGGFPTGATAITASQTGTTAATTATLASAASKTTYICGFTITSDATTALAGTATVTNTITGTLNYIQNVGSATAAGLLTQTFSPCIPANATATGINVISVAAGTGGNTAVTAWGYQQ